MSGNLVVNNSTKERTVNILIDIGLLDIGFIGNFEHNLDPKNRVFIPRKFREALGESFIIRVKPSRHPKIECFTEKAFAERVQTEVAQYEDELMRERMLFASCSNASQVTVDSQGRICIPAKILEQSHITKECLFIGMGPCVQIWRPEIHDEYYNEISAEYVAEEDASLGLAESKRRAKRATTADVAGE